MFGKRKTSEKTCSRGHPLEDSWEQCPFCVAEDADAPEAAPALRDRDEDDDADAPQDPGDGAVVVSRKAAPTRRLAGWLVVSAGEDPDRDYRLHDGRNVLGKGAHCDVSLKDALASERHAVLVIRDGVATVDDLDSRHGTTLDGEPLTDPTTVPDGGRLVIGTTELVYRSFPRT